MTDLSSSSVSHSDYESRLQRRIQCKFQVVVHADVLGIFHGFVREIAINRATICLEQNLQNAKTVKLRIHYPTRIISVADREHLEAHLSGQTG